MGQPSEVTRFNALRLTHRDIFQKICLITRLINQRPESNEPTTNDYRRLHTKPQMYKPKINHGKNKDAMANPLNVSG